MLKYLGLISHLVLLFPRTLFMLKELLKQKLMEVFKINTNWKTLVIDEEALFILDNTLKMTEILQNSITQVQSLSNKRKGDKEVLYLVQPSVQSITQIVKDFDLNPLYSIVHIFCLTPCSDALFGKIQNGRVKQFIKTFQELNIEFIAPDPNFFSLEQPAQFKTLFDLEESTLVTYELQKTAKKIASVLVNLNELPYIRFHTRPQAFQTTPQKSLSSQLAMLIQQEMDIVVEQEPMYKQNAKRGISISQRCIDHCRPTYRRSFSLAP